MSNESDAWKCWAGLLLDLLMRQGWFYWTIAAAKQSFFLLSYKQQASTHTTLFWHPYDVVLTL